MINCLRFRFQRFIGVIKMGFEGVYVNRMAHIVLFRISRGFIRWQLLLPVNEILINRCCRESLLLNFDVQLNTFFIIHISITELIFI